MTRTQPNLPKLGALAVMIREGRVLLVKRRNEPDAGKWGFPGGHVEYGETALQAAARELREETGVCAKPIEYITSVDAIEETGCEPPAFHFFLVAVRCEYVSGTPHAADDVSEARWVDTADVMDHRLDLSSQVDNVLTLALSVSSSLGGVIGSSQIE